MSLLKMLNDDKFNIFFSILLGIGIVCILKPVCTGANCSVNKPPVSSDFDKYVYKMGKKCYEFTPEVIECSQQTGEKIEAFKECNMGVKDSYQNEGFDESDLFARRRTIIKRCE